MIPGLSKDRNSSVQCLGKGESEFQQIWLLVFLGFLGSGKTTAIAKLLHQRPVSEHWSIFVNEFGKVSIDHALVDSCTQGVAVEKLGGGCACCTMSFAFKPLLAQFIRRLKPDRLILEPSGVSHPAKVVDILRSSDFAGAIDLRNIICLIDPKDLNDPRWNKSEVFQDQVQLADIVIINWTDARERKLIDACRTWVEGFDPPKQLILETSFGVIDSQLLDQEFDTVRFPLFSDAHPAPKPKVSKASLNELLVLENHHRKAQLEKKDFQGKPEPGHPLRYENGGTRNGGTGFHACGWVFRIDDVFDQKKLTGFLGEVQAIVRLKGVLRCEEDWWQINRAKESVEFSKSSYRRDSRLEVIFDSQSCDWVRFERSLLQCFV